MIEIWKDVLGFDGDYEVSNLGRVRSNKKEKGYILSPGMSTSGYLFFVPSYKGRQSPVVIHRAVIEAFSGKLIESGLVVNHIDHDKLNNQLDNLEVTTPRINCTCHKHLYPQKTSSLIGGYFQRKTGKYRGRIRIEKWQYELGAFDTEEEMNAAYLKAWEDWEKKGIKPEIREYTSCVRGVNFDSKRNTWRARKYLNRKEVHIGSFDTENEAVKAIELFKLKHNLK